MENNYNELFELAIKANSHIENEKIDITDIVSCLDNSMDYNNAYNSIKSNLQYIIEDFEMDLIEAFNDYIVTFNTLKEFKAGQIEAFNDFLEYN